MKDAGDVAFTPAVEAVQARKGSRASYARQEEIGSWKTRITPDLKIFIAAQTSVFFWRPPTRRVSPTFNTAAVPRDSCGCSTKPRSVSSISSAIDSTPRHHVPRDWNTSYPEGYGPLA